MRLYKYSVLESRYCTAAEMQSCRNYFKLNSFVGSDENGINICVSAGLL